MPNSETVVSNEEVIESLRNIIKRIEENPDALLRVCWKNKNRTIIHRSEGIKTFNDGFTFQVDVITPSKEVNCL